MAYLKDCVKVVSFYMLHFRAIKIAIGGYEKSRTLFISKNELS